MLTKLMRFYIPGFIRKQKLREVFRLTADAFQTEIPKLRGLTLIELLSAYALFTREQSLHCLQDGCVPGELKARLYRNSFIFGKNLRKNLHIISWEESAEVLKVIYGIIGIDFQYDSRDKFIIGQCFFSRYYTAEVCGLISSLDEGLAAGLTGGRLCFTQRITDGGSCCKGCLKQGGVE